MEISRVLPILNAVGCLVLTALVVTLWNTERSLGEAHAKLNAELRTAREQAAAESDRSAGLARDIVTLKESIEEIQVFAEDTARLLAEKETENAGIQAEAAAAREQVKSWQVAIAERDAKLRELDAELSVTRQRLATAVAKLKAAR